MKRRIAGIPVLGALARRMVKAFRGWRNSRQIRNALHRSPRRIVIGASATFDPGWIPTEIEALNILKEADWARFFIPGSIDALLAEHVWEHLTAEEAQQGAALCHRYLKPGGYLRIAVPDGNHPDPEYRAWVKPGGSGAGADDHKLLYTHASARLLFERAGFEVRMLEYFDDAGKFHYNEWAPEDGMIHRSKRFDKRNRGGKLGYTSIVLDAVKPSSPPRSPFPDQNQENGEGGMRKER
ncbi:MAG: methyltransferase domain-containing protein [Anaerolineales bacterium]|nr:methyltransferase domain-containing protein [Anaerolineales bacterium]